ncbi:hypothetical protein OXX69_006666, partial [Metschnikowia pulcherrima]
MNFRSAQPLQPLK